MGCTRDIAVRRSDSCDPRRSSTVELWRGLDRRCWWRLWFSSFQTIPVDGALCPDAKAWCRSRHRERKTCGCRCRRFPTLSKHSSHHRWTAGRRWYCPRAELWCPLRCRRCIDETEPTYINMALVRALLYRQLKFGNLLLESDTNTKSSYLFGENSENFTSESFCFTITEYCPCAFFTVTILSSLKQNCFILLAERMKLRLLCASYMGRQSRLGASTRPVLLLAGRRLGRCRQSKTHPWLRG